MRPLRRRDPLSRYRDLLSRGPFRGFLFAGSLSFAAPTAVLVALSWSIATAYPSSLPNGAQIQYAALALALLGLSATIPTLAAAIISGTLADRVARRRLMQLTNGLALVGTLGMMVVLIDRPSTNYYLPGPSGFYLPEWVVLLFPLWAIVSAGMTLFRPAFNASLPRLVSKADLGTANGLVYAVALSFSLIGLLGTPLLMAKFGNGWALILAVLLFVATEGALLGVSANVDPPPTGAPRRSFLSDAGDGYRYLWQRKELLQVTASALLINFFSAVAFVELALYVSSWLGSDQSLYVGGMIAGASIGAALGSILINRFGFERRAGRFLALLTMGQGVAVIILAFSRTIWISLPDMFLFGLFPGMFTTVFLATIQATVPNDKLGRVLAADEVGSYALVPFGQYAGGEITLYSNVMVTYLAAGVGTAAVGLFMASVGGLRRLAFEPEESHRPVVPPPGATGEILIADPPPLAGGYSAPPSA